MKIWFASSINISPISVLHVENGAQFLNVASALLFGVTVTSPVAKVNTSK